MFYCDQCGECCRHVQKAEPYRDLDRGDGVCKYLQDNKCSIYANRPLICRVDECYERFFKEQYTKEQYYHYNHLSCLKLKLVQGLPINEFVEQTKITFAELDELASNLPDSNTLKQIVKEDESQAKKSGTPSSTQGGLPSPPQV